MDTTYRKNLKAVLTASKNYTDNSIEKLKWELGTYDLSVETINGTTTLLPTPANTIQATMVRIDGNSEVSEGFDGIHNLELSGLKVEGANLISEIKQNGAYRFNFIAHLKPNTNYYFSSNKSLQAPNLYIFDTTHITVIATLWTENYGKITSGMLITTPIDLTENDYYIEIGINDGEVNLGNAMLNYGSTALPYADYVQPTTLPIDLTSIEDSGGNKLFEDGSLKGVGTAKDYITPYVAHKEIGSRAYQSGDEEDTSVLTDGTTTLYPLATPIEADIDLSQLVKFEAHSNGTITLVNTNNQDTTSTFKYLKEVAK